MKIATLILTLVVSVVLTGCGGDDPYCVAIKENRASLDGFGQTRTDAAFAKNAKTVRSIAMTSPDKVKDDWSKLGEVTDGVVKAHKSAGIALEDMSDTAKVDALDENELKALNKAYDEFNDTAAERKAVVANVKSACDITLK